MVADSAIIIFGIAMGQGNVLMGFKTAVGRRIGVLYIYTVLRVVMLSLQMKKQGYIVGFKLNNITLYKKQYYIGVAKNRHSSFTRPLGNTHSSPVLGFLRVIAGFLGANATSNVAPKPAFHVSVLEFLAIALV